MYTLFGNWDDLQLVMELFFPVIGALVDEGFTLMNFCDFHFSVTNNYF